MKYFGPWWDRPPLIENAKSVLTPVGDECPACKVEIELGDQGLVVPYLKEGGGTENQTWHRECFQKAAAETE